MSRLSIKRIVILLIVAMMLLFATSCGDFKHRSTKETGAYTDSAADIFDVSGFISPSPELLKIDNQMNTVSLGNNGGNHLAVYSGNPVNDFTLAADVRLWGGDDSSALSAALLFGVEMPKVPSWKWYGANIDTSRLERSDLFRVFGTGINGVGFTTDSGGEKGDIDVAAPLRLKLDVDVSGNFTYSFGNVGTGIRRYIRGTIPDWEGGYVGISTFKSNAEFSNIEFVDRSAKSDENEMETSRRSIDVSAFRTDLIELSAYGRGNWRDQENGLYCNSVGVGNAYACSRSTGKDFIFSANVIFVHDRGTATLVFRSDGNINRLNAYGFSLNGQTKTCRLTRWSDGIEYQLTSDHKFTPTETGVCRLKVVAIGSWISCYVNDVLIASTGDYVLQISDRGQDTILMDGYFGLKNLNGEVVFQDVFVTPIDDATSPLLTAITVESQSGIIEKGSQFSPLEPVRIQFVENSADSVDIHTESNNVSVVTTVIDENGVEYPDGKAIPIAVGINQLTVTSTAKYASGADATVNYRMIIWRRQQSETYYKEPYRDQYHYSVQEGRANDPNGLVYYDGTYHLFYQFSTGLNGGPKHWAHAVSKDLLTWENMPIAFYPDSNGTMYSGCIVADQKNTSGLFSSDSGGLVALISVNGNGQRIKAAYSEDEGITWTKLDKIVLDWTDDPLQVTDLRDPKVFRWENKWFMVVAGGPLRIYSSDDLLDWTCESVYPEINTECPDLYPLRASDGMIKWVLSMGGRSYKVGDFSQINGQWTFTPDEEYVSSDGTMNFGSDSYAAMTYYIQDFGSAAAPALPEIIELNWMNTLKDYRNLIGEKVNGYFNGTFNLNLNVGLSNVNGIYQLTQTPIEAYKGLRDLDNAMRFYDVDIGADNMLFSDFSSDCYEIVSTFLPGNNTKKVGFRLRIGDGEETTVVYDLESRNLMIDRSRSGIVLSEQFAEVCSRTVTANADGSIDMHIFVDRASIEVFANGNTAAGAVQIFPSESSRGLGVIVEGDQVKADIEVYPLNGIWNASQY